MPDGHRIPQDMNDWMRGVERRIGMVERRPAVMSREQILGQAIAPGAKQVIDWNAGENLLTGWYWSDAPAANAPIVNQDWMGMTITAIARDGSTHGTQTLTSIDGTLVEYRRRFVRENSTTAATFTAWNTNFDTGWIIPTFINGYGDHQGARYRRLNGITFLRGYVAGPNGDNQPMFMLPPGFQPSISNHIFHVWDGTGVIRQSAVATNGAVWNVFGIAGGNVTIHTSFPADE